MKKSKTLFKVNKIRGISLMFIILPFFIGSFLEYNYGVKDTYYLLFFLIPFAFIDLDKIISSVFCVMKTKLGRVYFFYLLYGGFTLAITTDVTRGGIILMYLSLPIMIGVLFSHYNLFNIIKIISWSGFVYTLLLYLNIPKVFLNYYAISDRFAYYNGDIVMNPNGFSIFLNCIAIYFLFQTTKFHVTKKFLIDFIAVILIFYMMLETGSRSGIFTFVTLLFLTLIYRTKIYKYILLPFLISFVFILMYLNINLDFNTRISELNLNSRDDIWGVALEQSTKKPVNLLFGHGIGSAERIIGEEYIGYRSIDDSGISRTNAHNLYIENLLNLGVLGLSLLIIFFVCVLTYFYRRKSFEFNYIPLSIATVIAVSGFSGNQMRSYYFLLFFAIVFGYLIQNEKVKNQV